MANSLKSAKSIYLTFSPFEFCNFVVVLLLPLLLVLLITFILVSPLMSMLGDTLGEGGELLGPDDPDSLSPLALACNWPPSLFTISWRPDLVRLIFIFRLFSLSELLESVVALDPTSELCFTKLDPDMVPWPGLLCPLVRWDTGRDMGLEEGGLEGAPPTGTEWPRKSWPVFECLYLGQVCVNF